MTIHRNFSNFFIVFSYKVTDVSITFLSEKRLKWYKFQWKTTAIWVKNYLRFSKHVLISKKCLLIQIASKYSKVLLTNRITGNQWLFT